METSRIYGRPKESTQVSNEIRARWNKGESIDFYGRMIEEGDMVEIVQYGWGAGKEYVGARFVARIQLRAHDSARKVLIIPEEIQNQAEHRCKDTATVSTILLGKPIKLTIKLPKDD